MREGQRPEDYMLLYMLLQQAVYLFSIIYNYPQPLKDLKPLYKQNVMSKITKWTAGYSKTGVNTENWNQTRLGTGSHEK